jgi:hypothetical protein
MRDISVKSTLGIHTIWFVKLHALHQQKSYPAQSQLDDARAVLRRAQARYRSIKAAHAYPPVLRSGPDSGLPTPALPPQVWAALHDPHLMIYRRCQLPNE